MSSGSPQRLSGVMPWLKMRLSYFSVTAAVMSVLMMPGRISYTLMLCSERRSAKSLVIMETPAFDTQYSPRPGDEVYEDMEAMLIIMGLREGSAFFCSIIHLATSCVRK